MNCHICQSEAVARCFSCGELVCAEHGKGTSCPRCSTGFAAGDPRHDRITVEPLKNKESHGWWRPKEAEEYAPPACYACQGLTRAMCRNCQSHYCRDHAGFNGLCRACAQSANIGLYAVAGILALLAVLFLCQWLFAS